MIVQEQENKVRNHVKKFVEEFNNFVKEKGRPPRQKYEDEFSLASKWTVIKRGKELTDAEKDYVEQFLVKVENIRPVIREFAEKYTQFIKEQGRKPKASNSEEERVLYRWFEWYTKSKHLNEAEIKYLTNLGFEIRYPQTDNIRPAVKKFVKDYNAFVEINHRDPTFSRDEDEKHLYLKWQRYTGVNKSLDLNDDEREYIAKNLSKVNIRRVIKLFADDLSAFIKVNGRLPKDKFRDEKNLFNKWKKYTNPDNINEYESKYLTDAGIDIKTSSNENIRLDLKFFVRQYKEFKQTKKREPSYSSGDKSEIKLYLNLVKYQEAQDLTTEEISYLNENKITYINSYEQILGK